DLAVIHHLKPVLDMAQIPIGFDHRFADRGRDAAGVHQGQDRGAGRWLAQAGMPAAPDQLLRLSKKLDLADAPAPQLDVVAANGNLAMALDRVDLTLD